MIFEFFENFGNMLVILLLSYYTFYVITLINKRQRTGIQQTNKRLEELRNKHDKTMEEQKEFIGLKYPKKGTFKFSWKWLLIAIGYAILFIGINLAWINLFGFFLIKLKLWHAILIVFISPIIVNLILKKFKLEKDSILNMI